jgi:hypothetical protein
MKYDLAQLDREKEHLLAKIEYLSLQVHNRDQEVKRLQDKVESKLRYYLYLICIFTQ